TLAILLGLGLWRALLAMAIGTVLGALLVAYLSTMGPRTRAGQLPNSRMVFGSGVVLPGILQWLGSIACDGRIVRRAGTGDAAWHPVLDRRAGCARRTGCRRVCRL